MHILIAPDSFKDSLGAPAVAVALAKGIRKSLPKAGIRTVPMADGGEGTVESIIEATGGRIIQLPVLDPLMREVSSFYGITGDGSTAVIEMAAASGLELLDPEERDPWITSTYGTGQLVRHALDQGCRKIVLGIGGSATNDAGTGMARALGVRFLDGEGAEVTEGGGSLGDIRVIRLEGLDPRIGKTRIRVACDVTNPLTGLQGASHVYGPQKGADPEKVKNLDANLTFFAELVREQLSMEISRVPGAGAAGGLGAGLMVFLGGTLVKGFDLVAETVGLEAEIQWADLVITGEGRMDRQTRFGKTPFGVAQMAKDHGKAVIGIAGTLEQGAEEFYRSGFDVIIPIQERPVSLEEALHNAAALLERTGDRLARCMRLGIRLAGEESDINAHRV